MRTETHTPPAVQYSLRHAGRQAHSTREALQARIAKVGLFAGLQALFVGATWIGLAFTEETNRSHTDKESLGTSFLGISLPVALGIRIASAIVLFGAAAWLRCRWVEHEWHAPSKAKSFLIPTVVDTVVALFVAASGVLVGSTAFFLLAIVGATAISTVYTTVEACLIVGLIRRRRSGEDRHERYRARARSRSRDGEDGEEEGEITPTSPLRGAAAHGRPSARAGPQFSDVVPSAPPPAAGAGQAAAGYDVVRLDPAATISPERFESLWQAVPVSGAFSCVVGAVPSGNEVCEHLNEHGFLPIATGEVDGVYKAFFYAESVDGAQLLGSLLVFTSESPPRVSATFRCTDVERTAGFVRMLRWGALFSVTHADAAEAEAYDTTSAAGPNAAPPSGSGGEMEWRV